MQLVFIENTNVEETPEDAYAGGTHIVCCAVAGQRHRGDVVEQNRNQTEQQEVQHKESAVADVNDRGVRNECWVSCHVDGGGCVCGMK